MLHLILASFFWHPLGYCSGGAHAVDACRSYNFWSGIVGDVTIFTGTLAGVALFWRKHNCHIYKCWRLQWHVDPTTGHPVCKKHHPHDPANLPAREDKLDTVLKHLKTHQAQLATVQESLGLVQGNQEAIAIAHEELRRDLEERKTREGG